MDESQPPLKIVIMGNVAVGKTSLLHRYTSNTFMKTQPTIGVEFGIKVVHLGNRSVRYQPAKLVARCQLNHHHQPRPQTISPLPRLQIWDTGGMDRAKDSLPRTFFRDALGCMLVYDIASPRSFEDVAERKAELDKRVECDLPEGVRMPCVLVSSRCKAKSKPHPHPLLVSPESTSAPTRV